MALFLLLTVSPLLAQNGGSTPAFRDKNKSLDEQAREIISQMTTKEKIYLTVGDGKFLPAMDQKNVETGTGIIIANQQARLVIPRLGIRKSALTDGPAGINRDPKPVKGLGYTYTTAFPTSTCLAATWNTDLAEKVGRALGAELLAYDYDLILMPAMNLHRDPRCGRNFEYYSEDPLISGKMAAAVVRGVQSKDVGATLKHFVANNQETNRRLYNAVISQRALRELYLRGFEIAVKESRPQAIMTSYNRLNGFYTAENPDLLQTIVRQEWGFDGLFMTDFDGYGSAVAKVRAGNNMLMGGNRQEIKELEEGLKNRTLDESTLDSNLIYNIKLKLQSHREKGILPTFKPNLETSERIAREAAGEGMVLLKNDHNTLPFNRKVKHVALFGKMSYYLVKTGTGSGGVRSTRHAISVNDGIKAAGYKILKDLEAKYTAYVEKIKRDNLVPPYFDNPKMRKDNGIKGNQAPPHFKERLVPFTDELPMSVEEIRKYEPHSDIAIVTLARSGGENYENGWLPITPTELALVKNVCEVYHAAGKKVVVVLNIGGVWETTSWRDNPDAILLAWQPGQEGGYAVADILSGKVNPSGKLPDTFPLKLEDVPSYGSFPGEPKKDPYNSFYKEGIYVGYRYYETFGVQVAYPFGYGLSYTTFQYSDLRLSSKTFDKEITVSVTVKNTGKRAGKEVVQLYLAAPRNEIDKPFQELKGFAKTKLLKPGESQTLSFVLDARALASFWSGIDAWLADKGDYEVRIGASSTDIRLRDTFTLPAPLTVEKVHDVLYPNFNFKEMTSWGR